MDRKGEGYKVLVAEVMKHEGEIKIIMNNGEQHSFSGKAVKVNDAYEDVLIFETAGGKMCVDAASISEIRLLSQ